mgnify:CR=1 FL=1
MLHKVLASLLAFFTIAFCPAAYAGSYGEVQLAPSYKASYRAVTGFFTPVASTTDATILQGSASKTVRITNVWLLTNAYVSAMSVFLIKRSTANSGGTSTTAISVPLDSANAAASVSGVKLYTANPTTGTSAGNVGQASILGNGLASSNTNMIYNIYTASPLTQAFVLRGTSEGAAINFNGVTGPASISVIYEWTEE